MPELVLIIFYIIILAYSIILHEISHGVVALWQGDRTAQLAGRLTLNPKSHVDPFGTILLPLLMFFAAGIAFGWAKPVPFNPYNLRYPKWGPTLVALAGPATNFLLALIAAIIGKLIPLAAGQKAQLINSLVSRQWEALLADLSGSLPAILFVFCIMAIFWNVLLGIFNLIPIPPLDGSKLLFALVPMDPRTQAMLEQFGLILVFAFVFLFQGPLSVLFSTFWNMFFSLAI